MTRMRTTLLGPSRWVHSQSADARALMSVLQVAEMYERQALAQSGKKKKGGGDADDGFW